MVDYYGLSAKKISSGTLLQWYPSTRSQSAVASENFSSRTPQQPIRGNRDGILLCFECFLWYCRLSLTYQIKFNLFKYLVVVL